MHSLCVAGVAELAEALSPRELTGGGGGGGVVLTAVDES